MAPFIADLRAPVGETTKRLSTLDRVRSILAPRQSMLLYAPHVSLWAADGRFRVFLSQFPHVFPSILACRAVPVDIITPCRSARSLARLPNTFLVGTAVMELPIRGSLFCRHIPLFRTAKEPKKREAKRSGWTLCVTHSLSIGEINMDP